MIKNWERLGCLKPEEKVRSCMDKSDGCFRVCADGTGCQFPSTGQEELIEELRERLSGPNVTVEVQTSLGSLLRFR